MITNQNVIHTVIIAGAGCGDPELITVKAVRYLQEAEVVLTDRLVSQEILDKYIKPGTEIVFVGKQYHKKSSVPQASINELIVKYALEGKKVVRLKGGDVAFFSNVLDEMQSLKANNIPFELVPGITAASGASASAFLPLTARGHATAVRFLTVCETVDIPNDYWKELAHTDDTLVFYMSASSLYDVAISLKDNGIDQTKSIAVISQATTPFQEVKIFDFTSFDTEALKEPVAMPALLVIGKTVALHREYSTKQLSNTKADYFTVLD